LYYLRARYYSADLGRFISRDPIGIADDLNLYAYVGDSPVMGVDLSGMSKTIIFRWEDYLSYKFTRLGDNLNFKYKAERYRDYLIDMWMNQEDIIVADWTTFESWQNYLQYSWKISRIYYFWHWSKSQLFLSDWTPSDLSDNMEAGLRTITALEWVPLDTYNSSWTDRDHYIWDLYNANAIWATIFLYSCNGANNEYWVKENTTFQTIAHWFSEQFQWAGIWATSNVNFIWSRIPWSGYLPEVQNWGTWKTYLYNE